MILALLALHLVAAVGVAALTPRYGARVLAASALAPALTAVWAATRLGEEPVETRIEWVPGLDLAIAFAVDQLAAVLAVIVGGIGAAVMVYAGGYFASNPPGANRLGATMLVFGAAMVGLVWSADLWTMFVFWELTSITSFLLVGHRNADPVARLAARRALVITAAGGLVLLGGFALLAFDQGTATIDELGTPTGAVATTVAVCVLVAAATKSAQVPFHVWLPGAMSAPTPVSAYLHSATMVKAGLVLIAVMAPALGDIPAWTPIGVTLGLATTVWGGLTALRHDDAKLVLAWGTVSQLGLIFALLSIGDGKATLAAVAVLVAHAVFKAALFMVIGEIDVRTGTRSLRRLHGLTSSMPIAATVAFVSAASMAGFGPVLGFAAKEAAIEAVLGLDQRAAGLIVVAVVTGSVLTVAYTVRLLLGLFGPTRHDLEPITVAPRRSAMTGPAALLGLASVLGFVALGAVSESLVRAASEIDAAAATYELLRWPGFTTAWWTSLAIVVVGTVVGAGVAQRDLVAPASRGAAIADTTIDGIGAVARRVAAAVQHGSLPVYGATMAAAATLAAAPFVVDLDLSELRWADNPMQLALAVLVVMAALAASNVTTRLGAALALGAVGLGVAALFVAHGAPDLAITQLLVETIVVVAFVLGLGALRRGFPTAAPSWRRVRIAVAVTMAVGVVAALVAAGGTRTTPPPTGELVRRSVDDGGGDNVVNVILTDVRALDTLGEVMVLVVVALGVLALAGTRRGRRTT